MNASPSVPSRDQAFPRLRLLGRGAAIAPDMAVVLRRPRRLRGTPAIVRRPVTRGWEVEIRTENGTPLHLTLPGSALRLR